MSTKIELTKKLVGLPAYFGGKRKLLAKIFELIPTKGIFVDPMSGSGAVSIAAKHLGFKVLANDRLYGPFFLGKALLEGNNPIDLKILPHLLLSNTKSTYINDTFGGVHLPHEIAKIADNIYSNIKNMELKHQYIYLTLLYRFLVFMAPYQQFRYKKLVSQYYSNTYNKSMKHHIDRWKATIEDPLIVLEKFANQLNQAIVDGLGSMSRLDVLIFLKSVSGDILYLDPPYAGASVTYEAGYGVVDQMISQVYKPSTSIFNNQKKERETLKELLEEARKFQIVIFSYWTKLHNQTWFEELFSEVGYTFKFVPIEHSYLYSTKGGVNNSQIGEIGNWNESTRLEKGAAEILYLLTPKPK
jgi:adenine-specific DNA-methyltransferase